MTTVQPKGESLRNAIGWLLESRPTTRQRISDAARRFDLSPLEEEFLITEFLKQENTK